MDSRRQFGLFSIEPLICLLLISLIVSWVLHWQKTCYQQLRDQVQQIQNLQRGMTLVGILISLLLTSVSVLAICQIHLSVQNTRMNLEDLLRQHQVSILFYLAMEPYIDKANYLGCNSARFRPLFSPLLQIHQIHDAQVPLPIRQKTLENVPILFIRVLTDEQEVLAPPSQHHVKLNRTAILHPGDTVILNDCEHAELHKIAQVEKRKIILGSKIVAPFTDNTMLAKMQSCWLYLQKSQFSYFNSKPMHTLFSACDHQPPMSLVRGIKTWKIQMQKNQIIFDWQSESALMLSDLQWQTNMTLYNAV